MTSPDAEARPADAEPRRRILVTGGCGFIGHAVVDELAGNGHEVIAADIADPGQSRSDVTYARLDITRSEALLEAAEGVDSIVHCASVVSTRRNDGDTVWHHNHGGTLNVLAACERHDIARLVHISSASVVFSGHDIEGGDERLPYAEVAQAPYAASKIAAEQAVLAFASAGSCTQACALRPSLVFGPGDARLIPSILRQASSGRLKREIGSRDKLQDFTYVANVADAVAAAERRLVPGSPLNGQAYFVTNGEPMAFYAFVESLLTALGYAPPTRKVPFWIAYAGAAVLEAVGAATGRNHGEDRVSRFAVKYLVTGKHYRIDKARRDLGWAPRVTLAEGIERTVAHLAQQSDV